MNDSAMITRDKLEIAATVGSCIVLFILLSQPIWRAKELAAQIKDDCAKRGGVLLVHKGALATSYHCASRLDK